MAELLIVSRLLQFASVIVVFGCGAFRLYGLGVDPTSISANAPTTFDAWFWRLTTVGAVVVLVSALSLTLGVTANMAGSAAAAFRSRCDKEGAVRHQLRPGVVLASRVRRSRNRGLPCTEGALADADDPRPLTVAAG